MAIKIITDSACDMPAQLLDELNVDVMHFTVSIGGEDYSDELVQPKELMNEMRNGAVPKTSQVTVGKALETFGKYVEAGDSLIYIAFSSGLSGTYSSAMTAREQLLEKHPELDLTIIDTKCASTGFGLVVYKAALMARKGASKDEIIDAVRYYSANMEHIFTVDDLEYLFRGGRVSRAAALIGGLLGIKPILDVDEEGRLHPIEKVRGRKNAIKRLAEIAGERGVDLPQQTIGICHGDDIAAVEELKKYMIDMYGCKSFITSEIGGTIGSHSGPGTLSVFFLSAPSK